MGTGSSARAVLVHWLCMIHSACSTAQLAWPWCCIWLYGNNRCVDNTWTKFVWQMRTACCISQAPWMYWMTAWTRPYALVQGNVLASCSMLFFGNYRKWRLYAKCGFQLSWIYNIVWTMQDQLLMLRSKEGWGWLLSHQQLWHKRLTLRTRGVQSQRRERQASQQVGQFTKHVNVSLQSE